MRWNTGPPHYTTPCPLFVHYSSPVLRKGVYVRHGRATSPAEMYHPGDLKIAPR